MKNEHEAEKLLSSSEYKFLRKYAELRYQYFKDNALKYLVKNYRDFKGVEIIFAKSEEEQRERKIMVETRRNFYGN
jgi:thermostable 8-oxoguanine DNA glycosylase